MRVGPWLLSRNFLSYHLSDNPPSFVCHSVVLFGQSSYSLPLFVFNRHSKAKQTVTFFHLNLMWVTSMSKPEEPTLYLWRPWQLNISWYKKKMLTWIFLFLQYFWVSIISLGPPFLFTHLFIRCIDMTEPSWQNTHTHTQTMVPGTCLRKIAPYCTWTIKQTSTTSTGHPVMSFVPSQSALDGTAYEPLSISLLDAGWQIELSLQ